MTFMFKFNPRARNRRIAFTHHALERIPQRTGADTHEIRDFLRQAVDDLRERNPCGWLNPPDGIWIIPLPDGSGAVLERDQWGERKLVVKTILRAGMWDDDLMNRSRVDG